MADKKIRIEFPRNDEANDCATNHKNKELDFIHVKLK